MAASLAAATALGIRGAAAETIRISGTGGAIGTIPFLAEAYRKVQPDVRVEILPGMGSSGAVRAVLAGRLDIGLSGRALTPEERGQGGMEKPYAKTPIVFGANRSVKAEGLTLAEVVEIYAGKRDRWKNRTRLRLITRPPTDSDTEALKGISKEMSDAVDAALRRRGMIVAMTDQDAADMIENVPGAFGATTLSLVLSESRAIRVLALDGIVPGARALQEGKYPYAKTFTMVTRKSAGFKVRRFIEFVRSPEGAAILARYGQVAVR